MNPRYTKSILIHTVPAGIVLVILSGGLIYGFIQLSLLSKKVTRISNDLASTTVALSIATNNTSQLSQKYTDLHTETAGISSTLSSAQKNIDAVKSQVGGVEQAVGSISGTVGTLKKLSEVDPEILKKYSKVYFMNENYVPAHLVTIPPEYTYSTTRSEQFNSESWPYLNALLDAAKANNIKLFVKSGYRSFAEQKTLKTRYSVTYGAGTANTFSAEQGYSEHQLGTTLDFITSGLNGQLKGFDGTDSYRWLTVNAYKFGFVLSYPKGNTFYVYEPWHWRFVGVKLATYLHNSNLNFYDLDQRDIDKFLANTFD